MVPDGVLGEHPDAESRPLEEEPERGLRGPVAQRQPAEGVGELAEDENLPGVPSARFPADLGAEPVEGVPR